MNLAEAWDYNLKKVKGAKPNGKKWFCQLVIAESRTFSTISVSDPDEALVQYDILKVKHCVEHVKQSPLIAQRLIFNMAWSDLQNLSSLVITRTSAHL
jgi:hypothetical protein